MSVLYKSLQKLRRQEQRSIRVPSYVMDYAHDSPGRRYIRTVLISLGLMIIAAIPVFLIQSRVEIYQSALLKNDSPATVNVSETISVSEKDEPLSDMMDQDEDEELLIAGIDPVNESRVIPANNNDYTPLTVEQFSEKKPVVDASSDLSVQARPAVLPAAKTDREFKSSSQFPDDLGHFVLDTELVDHFSRQAERNRRAMALNKNIESAFASGDYNAFVRYLTMLNEILPEQSPLILKWEGILAMQQENYEQARDKFTAVLNRAPEDHIARANLALALVRLDQKAQARVLLAQLKIQVPDNPLVQTLSRVLQ